MMSIRRNSKSFVLYWINPAYMEISHVDSDQGTPNVDLIDFLYLTNDIRQNGKLYGRSYYGIKAPVQFLGINTKII